MREFIDKTSKRYVRINVIEPVTITTKEHVGWSSSFTTYLIHIQTNHWAFSLPESEVRRRFSEFCWLRAKLIEHHPNKTVPPLPPKRYFRIMKFDPEVIESRCQGLEKFLQRVMRSFVFLSDAAFHLFLQSELTVAEIEAKLHEEIKPNYVKRIEHQHLTSGGTSDGGGSSRTAEFNRSVSDGGSNGSSIGSTSASDHESDDRTSCGVGSFGSVASEMDLTLDKLDLDSHPPIRTHAQSLPITFVQVHSNESDSYGHWWSNGWALVGSHWR